MKLRVLLPGLLALVAPLRGQTPTPSPTATPTPYAVFTDAAQPYATRLAAGQSLVASATEPDGQELWTDRVDMLVLGHLNKQTYPASATLVEAVLSSHGQMVSGSSPGTMDQTYLYAAAIGAKVAYGLADTTARLSYLYPLYQSRDSQDSFIAARLALIYAQQLEYKATDALGKGDFANAVTCASDPAVLGNSSTCYAGIVTVAQAKARARANDALSWAKLGYLTSDFAHTQGGVDLVAAAYRSTDMNLTRANAFISAQNDASQANALASVPLPEGFRSGGLPEPLFAAVNLFIQGNNKAALQSAMSTYIAAVSNADLTTAAGRIAQNLRNIDGNLLRANAFISAQKAGTTYPITELQ